MLRYKRCSYNIWRCECHIRDFFSKQNVSNGENDDGNDDDNSGYYDRRHVSYKKNKMSAVVRSFVRVSFSLIHIHIRATRNENYIVHARDDDFTSMQRLVNAMCAAERRSYIIMYAVIRDWLSSIHTQTYAQHTHTLTHALCVGRCERKTTNLPLMKKIIIIFS